MALTDRKADDEQQVFFNRFAGGFCIERGSRIVVDPISGADPNFIRLVLLGRAMACLLRQRGWLPLHSSAIMIREQAVLFLGPSGVGKSSAAAAFAAAGMRVLADDLAAVRVTAGKCAMRPGFSALRLGAESRQIITDHPHEHVLQLDKATLRLFGPELPGTVPVRSIYVLDFADQFSIRCLPRLRAVTALSLLSFVRRVQYTSGPIAAHLKQCSEVATSVPVYAFDRPRSLAALPEMVRLILSHVP